MVFVQGVVIVSSGYRDGRDLPGVLEPMVTFYQAMKTFAGFSPGYINFLPQMLRRTRY